MIFQLSSSKLFSRPSFLPSFLPSVEESLSARANRIRSKPFRPPSSNGRLVSPACRPASERASEQALNQITRTSFATREKLSDVAVRPSVRPSAVRSFFRFVASQPGLL